MVDEFDTAVDDASRNFVWNVKVRSSGITAVLPCCADFAFEM